MGNNYTPFHVHTDMSSGVTNIDSITKYYHYIDYAAELGMKSFAFSEHGSFFGWIKKKEYIEKKGMKYIHAAEFYVTETIDEKIRDNKHVVLIARNYEAVLELNKLSSISFNKDDGHKYYNPRITIDELINTSDNVIVTTACLGGILYSGSDNFRKKFLEFIKKNKHRCFLEIQHHNVNSQIKYNQYLYNLSQKYNIPLIAGTDTHSLNEKHVLGRSILQKSKNIYFDNEDGWDLTFKTYDELVEAYQKQNSIPMDAVLEAIENTNHMANMIEEFTLDRSYKYPHLWENPEQTFMDKINQGIIIRGVNKYPNYQEYLDRIEYELAAYKHNGAIDFMLLMEDIISWCNNNDIKVGYGRGSVNGSVIAWLLGITEMDSIKHGLNFDRFMSTSRVSLSDIDTDFPPSKIEEVKQYIYNKHGLCCCDIITFNTVADKGAIRDVARALGIPLDEVSKICDAVDSEEEYKKKKNEYPELFEYVDIIKGTIVSVGSHPCGLVVAASDITQDFGIFTTSTSNYPISQIYMKEIDSLNYVKLDLLKLDTIELINETCKMANIERTTPDNLDITDINVWNSMRDDTTQIFQWEGHTGDNYIKKLLSDENIKKFKEIDENVDRMTLLSIGNSAIRPAGASYREDLANGVVRKSGSDAIDDFLKPTFGYLVFQCQIIEFLHSYCGFTMGEADIVRRHFAKKTGTENDIPIIKDGGYMISESGQKSEHYIAGFIATMKEKYNMPKEEAEETIAAFLQVIIDASSYLFSINHSSPYSYEGYACGWLRYYYPVEFITASLNINQDKEEKTVAVTNYAKKVGIIIEPIKFRYSGALYTCSDGKIYKGIASIKFLNAQIADELYALKNNAYKSFVDLLVDIKKTSVNSRQLEILIKLDFFSEFEDINYLLRVTELFDKLIDKKQIKKCDIESLRLSEALVRTYSENETMNKAEDLRFMDYMFDKRISVEECDDCIKYKYQTIDGKKIKVPNGYSMTKFVKKYEISEEEQLKYATRIVYGRFSEIDMVGLLTEKARNLEYTKCTVPTKIAYQAEHLGYIDLKMPNVKEQYYYVQIIDGKYGNKNITLYQLKTGNSKIVKVKKKTLEENPLVVGDIIKVITCDDEQKWGKNPDGTWYRKENEYESILKKYSYVK